MEEDVEIDLLLKTNEQVLIEAARLSKGENYVDTQETSKNTAETCAENQTTHLENLNNKMPHIDLVNDGIKQEINQEASQEINDTVLFHSSQEPTKGLDLNMSNSDDSDVEDLNSIHSSDGRGDFITEMMADYGLEYRQESLEQKQKQIKNKEEIQNAITLKTLNKLTTVHNLILKRDDLLLKLELKLQEELSKNRQKQNQTREMIYSLSTSDNIKIKEPSFTKRFFKKFGMPYFEDSNGFNPPPNEDFKKKVKRGELIPGTIPKVRFWTKIDKEKLLEAIRKLLVEENNDRIMKKIQILKKKLEESESKESEKLAKNIIHCQDQIRFTKLKSYLDLVSKENPDREYDWLKISAIEFNGIHSADDCRRFWNVYLKPSVNKARWEAGEDLNLMDIAEKQQLEDWDKIAKLLGTNRTAYQCFVHYHTRIQNKSDFASGKWTKEEDKKLLSVINASQIGDYIPWTKVASHMGNRNQCQVYNRWSNCLNPNLVKGKFTKEEDLLVVSGIEVFGMNYKEMSSLLTNRSVSQIRERYERHILPKTSKVGIWSLSEDEKLLSLVEKHGDQNWVAVSKEIKTRSRTQVRQRYSFIQYMIKSKPGWSIGDVKRRQTKLKNNIVEKTHKHVEKVRKEIEEIEKIFQLSKLERDTFRIEKLKELKDKILIKKYELKRRKRVFSDSSEVNKLLLDYFKNCPSKCQILNSKIPKRKDCNAYLNEILLLANYFGHELQLPESKKDIANSKRLSRSLKTFLRESLSSKQVSSSSNSVEEYFPTAILNEENNIDCEIPESDDTILMNDWWHSPPVPVTSLNFNEFFKRTVFDYSYGMHKDIWTSKINRSPCANLSYLISESEQSEIKPQRLYMPPNHLTTIGFRSILLSRSRLNRDGYEKDFVADYFKMSDSLSGTIKSDSFVNRKLLDQFQESMITLFTWPKVLSVNSINKTQVLRINSLDKVLQEKSTLPKPLHNNLEIGETSMNNNETQRKKTRRKKSSLDKKTYHKHEVVEITKTIRPKRKMKIEHLIKDSNKKADATITKKRKRGRKKKKKPVVLDQSTTLIKKEPVRPRLKTGETLCQKIITDIKKTNQEIAQFSNSNQINKQNRNTCAKVSKGNQVNSLNTSNTKNGHTIGTNNKECEILEIDKPLSLGSMIKTYERSKGMIKRANICDNLNEPVFKKVKYDVHNTQSEEEKIVDQHITTNIEMCLEIPPERVIETGDNCEKK